MFEIVNEAFDVFDLNIRNLGLIWLAFRGAGAWGSSGSTSGCFPTGSLSGTSLWRHDETQEATVVLVYLNVLICTA